MASPPSPRNEAPGEPPVPRGTTRAERRSMLASSLSEMQASAFKDDEVAARIQEKQASKAARAAATAPAAAAPQVPTRLVLAAQPC